MRLTTIAICAAAFLASCAETPETKVAAATTTTTPPEAPKPEAMPDTATINKRWREYATPGEAHKMMQASAGTWMGEVSMWMDPSAPPMKSQATTVNKMVLGGRYMQGTHKGTFAGEPFEGMSTLAYDNGRKVFVSTWLDNMGTGVMHLEGQYDPTTKTTTLNGKTWDCISNKEIDVRETYKVVDDNYHVLEMFSTGMDGKEHKTMEIKYTRKR